MKAFRLPSVDEKGKDASRYERAEKTLAEFYQEAGLFENERTEHSNKKNVHTQATLEAVRDIIAMPR